MKSFKSTAWVLPQLITFDPVHHTYIQLGKTVGKAFSDGKQLNI